MNTAPILIVDDDEDDREFIQLLCKELKYKNELVFFNDGESVLTRLKNEPTVPFLILCDVNIPKMNGFELKKKIQEDEDIRYKSIPFVFWSTEASAEQIKKAYDLGGNGFFIKENNLPDLKESLSNIMEYWFKSKVPEQ